jgi:hypothetical protein
MPYSSVADVNGDCAINGQDIQLMVNYSKGAEVPQFKCVIYICPIYLLKANLGSFYSFSTIMVGVIYPVDLSSRLVRAQIAAQIPTANPPR